MKTQSQLDFDRFDVANEYNRQVLDGRLNAARVFEVSDPLKARRLADEAFTAYNKSVDQLRLKLAE